MRAVKFVVPAAVLMAGFAFSSLSLQATPAYAKKEQKSCTVCHAKVVGDKAEMVKNLNSTGTCYKDNSHSLAKCAK